MGGRDRFSARLGRRDFLAATGGAFFVCALGERQFTVRTARDVQRVDAAAASLRRPASARRDRVDSLSFATPAPAPGGRRREYWLVARPVRWQVTPRGYDEWHARRVPRVTFRALAYQAWSAGFAHPLGPPRIPGPTLEAEVGDVIVVHFRNGAERLRQALTVHPHGVRYNPEYDGAYLGEFTRAGGFVAPGEEFTYVWEATPDSVGVWPYHDHGPNHTLNTFRGLFGAIVVRERGAARPDREYALFLHNFPPQITGADTVLHCINGRAFAGNTPTLRARVGERVAIHVIGMDSNFHTFHIHGHRWRDSAGALVDCPTVGPNETITAAFTEDNPGRWLYHCHVFSHQDAGMAGWYLVDPR
ncbi:multicopper oxidase domain-containing protein [Thermoleophilum album]|uniref:multicopper oxidase domain-containing protein n=1 Tax=Thermoleophilum album TaxID=29539 RepID=UPI00237C9656|nr:multicopper oxidase domain-containing protein [Thermoleophilum album]WDT94311.1 multicopper oxidase domain-containing protein [Thermoleophilum album]